jgi:hypothetical protein
MGILGMEVAVRKISKNQEICADDTFGAKRSRIEQIKSLQQREFCRNYECSVNGDSCFRSANWKCEFQTNNEHMNQNVCLNFVNKEQYIKKYSWY